MGDFVSELILGFKTWYTTCNMLLCLSWVAALTDCRYRGEMNLNAEFSRTLALLRQEKGVSQRTAADALGISQALMSHYEKGVREPGLAFVVRACDYYGVTSDYLLGRTLTRDGATVQADDLLDLSKEKSGNAKGSVYTTLHKKLVMNSMGMLFDLLGETENRDLMKCVSNYFSTTVSLIFRRLHNAIPRSNPSFFAVSQSLFLSGAYDVELKSCEIEFVEALALHKKGHGNLPDLNHDHLTGEYGPMYQSLLQNLFSNGKRVNQMFQIRCTEDGDGK